MLFVMFMTFCKSDSYQESFLANLHEGGEVKRVWELLNLRIFEKADVGYIRMDCCVSWELVGQLGGKTGNKAHVSIVKYNIYLDAAEIKSF